VWNNRRACCAFSSCVTPEDSAVGECLVERWR